eukprot:TRINITY_DN10536_c0_g1_i1.p1 TRINITY_DN10536_c0_g1~~TRINITY_DN10536_c0_g1_i1.p1  ORF type:complete len:298 (-),score=46.66 TRINITY_DN10536_c0_g1_i1:51-902(-)
MAVAAIDESWLLQNPDFHKLQKAFVGYSKEGRKRYSGIVRTFNGERAWGFIAVGDMDVMVHVRDCKPTDVNIFTGGQPQPGDIVTFDVEPRPENPSHFQAKRVEGGTAERACNLRGQGMAQPLKGEGKYFGTVKAFNSKGVGWITCTTGQDVWVQLKDCLGTRPCTGDAVQFDLGPCEKHEGKQQAVNVTGGSAPLDLDLVKKADYKVDSDRLKRNEKGHLLGCVCSTCTGGSSPSSLPCAPKKSHLPGCVCSACKLGGVVGTPMQQRAGPYSGGVGSMGRLY